MTIAVAKNRIKIGRTKKRPVLQTENDVWEAIRGMWKKKSVDAVKYQRKVRKEADHIQV